MAKVSNLVILNPADKTRMYAVATCEGSPADADDVVVTNIKDFPIGSQLTDTENKAFFVRTAAEKSVGDWAQIGA